MDKEMQKITGAFAGDTAEDKGTWEQAMPSEMAEAETAEASYGIPKKQALNKGTMILLAACVIGLGSMYLLKLRHAPKPASAEDKAVQAQVDQALQKMIDPKEQEKAKKLFNDTQQMVQTFYEYPSKQQISLSDLQRDPFSRDFAVDNTAKNEAEAARQRDRMAKDLGKRAETLKLQSVLQGAGGAKCLISGEVYGVGQTVAGKYVVKSIGDGVVVLTAENLDFTLKM
jgi:Tfp pilus assembly protein PilP